MAPELYEDFEHDGDPPQWPDSGPIKNAFIGSPLLFDTIPEEYEDIEEDWSDVGPLKTSFSGSPLAFDTSPSEDYEDFEHDGDPPEWADTGPIQTTFTGSPLVFDTSPSENYEDFEHDGDPPEWADTGPIKSAFIGSSQWFDDITYGEKYEDFEEEYTELIPHVTDGRYTNVLWGMNGTNPSSVLDTSGNGFDGNLSGCGVVPGKRGNGRRTTTSNAWLYNGMINNLNTAPSLAFGTFEFFVRLNNAWSSMTYWLTYPLMLGWMARRFVQDDAQISVEVDTSGDLLGKFKGVTINLGAATGILPYSGTSTLWFPVILQWDTTAQWVWFQAGNSRGKAATGGATLDSATWWWYNLGYSGWKTNPVAPTGLEYDEFIHSKTVKYQTW